MTMPIHTLSAFHAAQAAESGAVIFNAIAAGTDAALAERAVFDPASLREGERVQAEWLMGRLNLGRWTIAGDMKRFGSREAAMAAALAALKRQQNPDSRSFACLESVVEPGGVALQCARDREALQATGGSGSKQEDDEKYFKRMRKDLSNRIAAIITIRNMGFVTPAFKDLLELFSAWSLEFENHGDANRAATMIANIRAIHNIQLIGSLAGNGEIEAAKALAKTITQSDRIFLFDRSIVALEFEDAAMLYLLARRPAIAVALLEVAIEIYTSLKELEKADEVRAKKEKLAREIQ